MTETRGINRLKVAIVERGKTSRWLARELNKSETTVSRWMTNTVQPSLEQLYVIADVLDMDVKDLLVPNKK